MRLFSKQPRLQREIRYASHHHLIPLYILSGISLLALIVVSCFLAVIWQNTQRSSYLPAVETTVSAMESLFVPTAISPAEKKQYVYPANIRFAAPDPYQNLRFSYDPGLSDTKTGGLVTLTTTDTIRSLTAPMLKYPEHAGKFSPQLQKCVRMYAIRFEPGLIPLGGFSVIKDIKLKDGRTAYIHKNISCTPSSTQAMASIDKVEQSILSVESY